MKVANLDVCVTLSGEQRVMAEAYNAVIKAGETPERPEGLPDGWKPGTISVVIGHTTDTPVEATLEELVQYLGSEAALVDAALRQTASDMLNAVRADYKTGGERLAREQAAEALAARAEQGDVAAIREMVALLKKPLRARRKA